MGQRVLSVIFKRSQLSGFITFIFSPVGFPVIVFAFPKWSLFSSYGWLRNQLAPFPNYSCMQPTEYCSGARAAAVPTLLSLAKSLGAVGFLKKSKEGAVVKRSLVRWSSHILLFNIAITCIGMTASPTVEQGVDAVYISSDLRRTQTKYRICDTSDVRFAFFWVFLRASYVLQVLFLTGHFW